MPRPSIILRKGGKAIKDLNLLKILQSEIDHELSSTQFQDHQGGSLGDFTLDWDAPHSEDVLLRKKCETGEEVAVSALLGPESSDHSAFPRDVLMKVCIKKPGLSPILQFDCGVSSKSYTGSQFNISGAYYLGSLAPLSPSDYKGPSFSSLDPTLQDALKLYLESRGISENLLNFLLLHLHKREQSQYIRWLQKLEELVSGYNDECPQPFAVLRQSDKCQIQEVGPFVFSIGLPSKIVALYVTYQSWLADGCTQDPHPE